MAEGRFELRLLGLIRRESVRFLEGLPLLLTRDGLGHMTWLSSLTGRGGSRGSV